MRNRTVVVAVALLVVAGLVYWFGFRSSGDSNTTTAETSRDGKVHADRPVLAQDDGSDAAMPRSGRFSRWTVDVDPDGPLRLEGQVVGPDGKAIGSADVWLGASPDRETSSNEDGSFAFDHVVGKSYTLSASQGDLIGETTYKLTAKSDPVVIRLGDGARIAVTALDDDKHPVADVRVVAASSQRETTTDKDGKATLHPVHPGFVIVEGHAPGYASARTFVTVGTAGANAEVKLTMHRGVAVSGRVVDEAGKPIARAHVTVNDGVGLARGDDADTDAQGHFAIAAVAKGVHTLAAADAAHSPATSPAFLVGDKPVDNVEIKMLAGASVAGIVVDKDGKGVAFATVRFAGTGATRGGPRRRAGFEAGAWRTTTTDRDGRFDVRGLPRVHVSARAETGDVASKVVDVDLEANAKTTDLKLVLDVSGMIRGVVVDDTGQPVPEVAVHAVPDVFGGASQSELALSGLSSTTSDGGGNFAITGLPDGSYRLWAQRSSTSTSYGEGTPAKTGDIGIKVVLPATGGLTAKLAIEGSSAPPKLASVIVSQQLPTPVENGAVSIKDLAAGSYDVMFRGAEFASFTRHDVEIKPGQVTDLGTITLPKGRTLTGTVVDTSNTPIGGAKVKLGTMLFGAANASDSSDSIDDMLGVRNTVSDTDGTFTLTGVPVKATNVMADHPTLGRSIGVAVPAGNDDPPPVTLTIHGYGSISGKVTQQGQPVGGVQVADAQQGGGAQAVFAQTSSDGSFVMTNVPEGPQVLTVLHGAGMGMRGTSQQVAVVAGQQANVTIDIPVGTIELDVTVKPLPNQTVNMAQVVLFKGTIQFANAKLVLDNVMQAGVEGMKFWMGTAPQPVVFDQLLAQPYSACGIPITGNMTDPKFAQRLQENMELLKVYCRPITLAAAPAQQSLELDLPAMVPLPATGSGS